MGIWFCSDLHFGHKRIGEFRAGLSISNEEDNRLRIMDDWFKVVTKMDVVYVLGDACFTKDTLFSFGELPGRKILVRGNHDMLPTEDYLQYFEGVYGLMKYKHFWLSHAPIHPLELRGKKNLHGHVHYGTIPDNNYLNCCPEYLWPKVGRSLISLDEVRKHFESCT